MKGVAWTPAAKAELLELWDGRPDGHTATQFDREQGKRRGISTGEAGKRRRLCLRERKTADAWTSEWPTEPGWYWIRNGDGEIDVARAMCTGLAMLYMLGGGPDVGPGSVPDIMWGPRIPEPGTTTP